MSISVEELKEKNKYNTLNIIDTRDEYSYSKGHIVNAKNIPANYLMQAPENYLNYKEIYYIYCESGHTSNQIVNILNNRGYHTVNIQGGYNNYLLSK